MVLRNKKPRDQVVSITSLAVQLRAAVEWWRRVGTRPRTRLVRRLYTQPNLTVIASVHAFCFYKRESDTNAVTVAEISVKVALTAASHQCACVPVMLARSEI